MTMGECIKSLRVYKGLSQDQLGAMLGVNRAAINKWENGTVENIKRIHIMQMSKIFDVSPCHLLCFDCPKNEGTGNDIITEKLYDLYDRLNNVGKDKALSYISDLIEIHRYKK